MVNLFQVMFLGTGIKVELESKGIATGFYTTRTTFAQNEEEALLKLIKSIKNEWKQGEYFEMNKGNAPTLNIENCRKISLFNWTLSRKNKGYTFFLGEISE